MEIKICYVDDNLDPFLVGYLDKYVCNSPDYKYVEYEVSPSLSYNDLLTNERINESDILIIDSRLFEEVEYTENTLTGEELRFIIRKVFPYKEVLVISQNDTNEYDIESKFKPSSPSADSSFEMYEKEANQFYTEKPLPKIIDSRKSIEATKNILPALANEFISLFKETSVVGYISVVDITMQSKSLQAVFYSPEPVIFTGIVYYVSVKFFTLLVKLLERRLNRHD